MDFELGLARSTRIDRASPRLLTTIDHENCVIGAIISIIIIVELLLEERGPIKVRAQLCKCT